MAQRDAQRLEPPGRLLPLPLPRRRQGDGEGRRRRRPRRPGHRDVRPDVGQRVLGDPQQLVELGGEHGLLVRVVGEREQQRPWRRPPLGAEVAADGVPGGCHDVPGGERGGAPAGVPLAPLQPPLLAARLRGDRRDDRRLLLPAGLLRVPRRRRHAAPLPVPHHPAGPPRGGAHALAGAVVAAAAPPPGRPVRVHGAVGGRAGAARAGDQLGAPRVPPRPRARARHGARLRRRRRVLRQQGAGEVEAGQVRLRRAQPPDLPRARARRCAHALRRHGHPHQLAGGDGRRRRGGSGVVVTCGSCASSGQCICRQRAPH